MIPFFEKSILKSSYSTAAAQWRRRHSVVHSTAAMALVGRLAAFESHKQMRGDEEAFLLFPFFKSWVC